MSKLLFLDTNIIIKECIEKHSDISFLETLLNLLDDNDLILVIPEIIKIETFKEIAGKADLIIDTIKQQKVPNVDASLLEHLISEEIEVINSKKKTARILFESLLLHPKVREVPISNELILSSIQRQLRRLPPASKKPGKPDGTYSAVDYDSLNFETLLQEARREKCKEVIILSDDSDYYLDKDKGILKPPIDEEILSIDGIECISASNDPWFLLEARLGIIFEKRMDSKKTSFFEYQTAFLEIETQTPPPGCVIKGQTLSCLYWLGNDASRHVIPNEDVLRSWFPESAMQPHIYKITDQLMASILLGENITYRGGTRLIKIESDQKIYAIGNDGFIHLIESEKIREKIFGYYWRNLLVTVPDAIFADYKIGLPIEIVEDFNPDEAKAHDRLP